MRVVTKLEVNSPAFRSGATMPAKYTTPVNPGGENLSIPVDWTPGPVGAASYALVMVDHNSAVPGFVHWAVVDIPSNVESMPEGASGTSRMPEGSIEMPNGSNDPIYGGPQPPPGTGEHEYEIKVFALDTTYLTAGRSARWADVYGAMKAHILAEGSTTGRFG